MRYQKPPTLLDYQLEKSRYLCLFCYYYSRRIGALDIGIQYDYFVDDQDDEKKVPRYSKES